MDVRAARARACPLLISFSCFLVSGCSPAEGGVDASATLDTSALDAPATDAPAGDTRALDAPSEVDTGATDAAVEDTFAPAPDVPPDAAVCERVLFVGSMDPLTQGWTVVSMGPATTNARTDDVELVTTTNAGATSGGQLLLVLADAVATGTPFHLEVELEVVSTLGHNPLDAPAAVLGSFHAPFGNGADRAQMIYLDAGEIGWADGTGTFATAVTDGAFHTLGLVVDAAGAASVTWDGAAALTRTGFVTNGVVAIGDQTNDANVDATTRVREVRRVLCP